MELETKALITGLIGLLGAAAFFGLTIYPFQYGLVESFLLAGLVVIFVLFETVLDDTTF
ncbi:hypothetical protein ACH9L7_17460 (plasmid) [Haloferax sp. S1W]|uniref:hypothetical protein n=1 Tax=Haloferax sp. S1W TaxID=3377110 RepID=UPI0037CBF2CA